MNKNIAIGILAAVVIVGGGFLLMRTGDDTATPPKTTSDSKTPVKTTPNVTMTIGSPVVETISNFSASTSTVSVTGHVVPNGAPTVYWFEYNESTPAGSVNRTAQQAIGSGFASMSAPAFITGLRANTSYSFRLMASNSLGSASGATYTFTTNSTPAPKAASASVITRSASSISRTAATLNGQVSPNGWQTNYWFEYGTSSNFGNTSTTKTISNSLTSSSSVSQDLTELDPLTKYYFRLNAQNQFGTVNGSTLSFTTSGPLNPSAPAVTTSSASNISSESVRLNGAVNPDGADTTYWFEYSEDSLLGNIIGSGTPVQNLSAGTNKVSVQANVDNLNRRTKYFYRLVGRNQYGTTNGSIMSFTTKS